jgi:3-phosphoshikimate 1-carboxyvinyltransferase
MKDLVRITAPTGPLQGTVHLPASKSVSNRVLIIRALSGVDFPIDNLSDADDTRVLDECIRNRKLEELCGEGGTTFRFLLALRACQGAKGTLSAEGPMLDRPVAPLVDALNALGAGITYLHGEGRASVRFSGARLRGGEVTVPATISSQFLSALMLIGPYLPGGLNILLEGKTVSRPYIDMTVDLMREFGCVVYFQDVLIKVEPGFYEAKSFRVPPDWSAAAVFYAMAAARPGSMIRFPGLGTDRYQGDRALSELMQDWGVKTQSFEEDIIIHSSGSSLNPLTIDFENTPDLAQVFAVMAALLNRPLGLTGLSTLRNKETDRIAALVAEITTAGATADGVRDRLRITSGIRFDHISNTIFNCYGDHRMVMALSLLSLSGEIVSISGANSVSKSFPSFFEQLGKMGFAVGL